jgi:hypothetical protein
VPEGSTKFLLNITLANGYFGWGYSTSWKPRLNSRLFDMTLPCDKCWSSDILPHTSSWTLSNRIQTENQHYRITYRVITAPQNLEDVHCHLYVSHSHFAENESCKISNVCKYVYAKALHHTIYALKCLVCPRYISPTDGAHTSQECYHDNDALSIYSIPKAYRRDQPWSNDGGIYTSQMLQHAHELTLHLCWPSSSRHASPLMTAAFSLSNRQC